MTMGLLSGFYGITGNLNYAITGYTANDMVATVLECPGIKKVSWNFVKSLKLSWIVLEFFIYIYTL